ncbi:MAG: RagB/SusD family nutrient uptake outer membrane protein [Bacteroidota bacterium]|nr:RagB/SusD family nutrient uptake outer membrane protein [Bacteroidota bacterium]
MKMNIFKKLLISVAVVAGAGLSSCSLNEYNPSGYTFEALASSSVDGYGSIVNNIYFGMERCLYGDMTWMELTEAGTDIWTSYRNATGSKFFRYFSGYTVNLNYASTYLNCCYDGIGGCNMAIKVAPLAPFTTDSARNAKVAEAYFMRAVYYYHLVEQFGGVTVLTEPAQSLELHPEKTAPLDVYKQVIIPDLEFAAKWLPIGSPATTTRPTRKSAMGFLARAYLQTVEYDNSKAYASKALELAKTMIADCEAGGTTYGIRMYSTFDEVFLESNNFNNAEALWKHRFAYGGGSNAGYYLNRNDEVFYCDANAFPARKFDYTINATGLYDRNTWGGRADGTFMPSQYLLDLYVQSDGTLDPRYHKSFQTTWSVNKAFTWNKSYLSTWDRDTTSGVVKTNTKLVIGNTAAEFIMPGDANYASKSASRFTQPYIVADYKDVYANDTVVMYYKNRNINAATATLATNNFNSYYPSLIKHNSSNYVIVDATKGRFANLSGTFMMRTPEVYLIAAEADIYINGGANALGYLNKVRQRAGAIPLTGVASIQTVLDERGRELCGEYVRFYDLKRTGKLTRAYLNSTNPDVGKYFDDAKFTVRPFPSTFLEQLQGAGTYYQNPNY